MTLINLIFKYKEVLYSFSVYFYPGCTLLKTKQMEFGKIIISERMNSGNLQDVSTNISVINLMREEGVDDDLIHEDAIMSYYLIIIQLNVRRKFAQFVYNSGWDKELNELVEEGFGFGWCRKAFVSTTIKESQVDE
jgi:hypothetical protein